MDRYLALLLAGPLLVLLALQAHSESDSTLKPSYVPLSATHSPTLKPLTAYPYALIPPTSAPGISIMPSLQTVKSWLEWLLAALREGQVVVQGAIKAVKLLEASQAALADTVSATAAATATAMVATPAIAGS